MTKEQVFQLHPPGWEKDPDEERFKLSCLDPTPVCGYNQYLVYFRVPDSEKQYAADILKAGLEKTLSQARQYIGTIEPDPAGGHSFVKKKDSTVRYVVKWADSPEDTDYPSIPELESAYFACNAHGDLVRLSIDKSMTWHEPNPIADPNTSPVTSAFQTNLVRGGIIFSMHSHHYASDVKGWSNFTHQLADNCAAIAKGTPFPLWDPACIDVSRFSRHVPLEKQIDGPPPAPKHPDHVEQQACLFHLPASKAAEIKKSAIPPPDQLAEGDAPWISTYDAVIAYIWRVLSRVRARKWNPDLSEPLHLSHAVNMRNRLSPPVPERMMRNVLLGAFCDKAPVPRPISGQIVASEEEYPLWKLASYLRRLTESCTQKFMDGLIDVVAPIKDKRSISLRVDALPPMSIFVTDHRTGDIAGLDFGFGKAITYRHLWGEGISSGLILVYAPLQDREDEGPMFTVTLEKELVEELRREPGWKGVFEWRGVD